MIELANKLQDLEGLSSFDNPCDINEGRLTLCPNPEWFEDDDGFGPTDYHFYNLDTQVVKG